MTIRIGHTDDLARAVIGVVSGRGEGRVSTCRSIALACVLGAQLLSSQSAYADAFTNLFAFGDSLTDTGNLCPGSGCPSAPYLDGRFSNGPVWIEPFANAFRLRADPLPGGTNYAVGGFTTFDVLTFGIPSFSLDYSGVADPGALYVIWAGGNDGLRGADMAQAAARVAQAILDLSAMGAKFFLVPNLPDLGQTPREPASSRQISIDFNDALAAELAALTGVTVFPVDLFSLVDEIVANPGAFGFTNVDTACFDGVSVCLEPESFLWWDEIHPTAAAHALLAEAALAVIPVEFFPPSPRVTLEIVGLGVVSGVSPLIEASGFAAWSGVASVSIPTGISGSGTTPISMTVVSAFADLAGAFADAFSGTARVATTGTLGPLTGSTLLTRNTLPISGTLRARVFHPLVGFFNLPFGPLTNNGTRGVGIGGTAVGTHSGVLPGVVSVKGAPWMRSAVTVQGRTQSGGISTFSTAGFIHGPLSNTVTLSEPGGVMQLVTPIRVTTSYHLPADQLALFGRLTIEFVPEPSGPLLLASGLAVLLLLGRRRIQP